MKTSSLAATAAWLLTNANAAQFVMYTPGDDDTAVERADPILSVGKISQHVHQIFGSDGFAPEVSYESLQSSGCTTVGDASGNGNGADLSIYWHPALFMEASDGSGYIKVPTNGHKMYYKDAGSGTKRNPFEFPHGFRMLAGNPFMRKANSDVQSQNITQWICHSNSGSNQGTDGGFPTGVTDCDAYPGFNGAIHFPHCWNGDDFDPANPTAHITYPEDDIENGECPSSHPTRLPHIFMENQFDLHKIKDQVKPDSFVLAMGDNTGYGWHADFFNGWKDGAIPGLIDSCPQGEFGNEDVGSCPTFQKSNTKTSDCKLKVSYKENVEKPGKALPGCNPIVDTNPAPMYETAPLGTYSTNCKVAAGGPPAGNEPSGSPPSSAAPSSAAPSSKAPVESSTFAVSAKPSSSEEAAPSYSAPSKPVTSSSVSCPGSNGETYKSGGKTFKIQCSVDHSGGDLDMTYVSNGGGLAECIAACAKNDKCVDVSLSGTACYMKSELGKKVHRIGLSGAKLVDSGTEGTMTTMQGNVEKPKGTPKVGAEILTVTQHHTAFKTVHQYVTATPEKRHVREHVHAHAHGRRWTF